MDGFEFSPGAPKAVTDYLRLKGVTPSFDWQNISPEEHAYAFTVAKTTQVNVVATIKEDLQKALDEGIPFEQFKRGLTPRLKALGWWGTKDVTDPATGETRPARLGSPRRLKTIYWANTRTARAAGQWERIQRTKTALPYLLYQLGPSEHHRPHHEDKSGLMAPIDDPVWRVWFTPNGWGCKCHLRQISNAEAKRRGYPDKKMPASIPQDDYVNTRTGEVTKVDRGIDPGWNSNPGLTRQKNTEDFLAGALERAPLELARIAVADLVRDSEFLAHIKGERLLFAVPVAVLPEDLAAALKAKTRIVRLSRESAAQHSDPLRYPAPENWAAISANIENADVYMDGSRLIFKIIHEGEQYRYVIKSTKDLRELYLTTFHRQRKDKAIRGVKIKTGLGE